MPSGKHKSRTLRRVSRRVPGGESVIQYRKRKPAKSKCAMYGTPLAGVPNELPSKMANMPKTAKRPERPFGGVLSSKGMRDVMKQKAKLFLSRLRGKSE